MSKENASINVPPINHLFTKTVNAIFVLLTFTNRTETVTLARQTGDSKMANACAYRHKTWTVHATNAA